MKKSFYVVIPYAPSIAKQQGGLTRKLFSSSNSPAEKALPVSDFEEYRTQLEQRLSVVEQGLVRSGIRVARLGTEEIVELFYKIFNPGDLEKPMQLNS